MMKDRISKMATEILSLSDTIRAIEEHMRAEYITVLLVRQKSSLLITSSAYPTNNPTNNTWNPICFCLFFFFWQNFKTTMERYVYVPLKWLMSIWAQTHTDNWIWFQSPVQTATPREGVGGSHKCGPAPGQSKVWSLDEDAGNGSVQWVHRSQTIKVAQILYILLCVL